MSEATTVPAGLMAAGVGEPAVWRDPYDTWHHAGESIPDDAANPSPLDITDPTTERECLAQLAKWCGEDGRGSYWLIRCGDGRWALVGDKGFQRLRLFTSREVPTLARLNPDDTIKALAAILSHVGRDHDTRRATGHEPEPGTLWRLTEGNGAGNWEFGAVGAGPYEWFDVEGYAGDPNNPEHHRIWGVPALAGITDHHEAHVAIWKGVAS